MRLLGNGLTDADRHEDALSVYEAELSLGRGGRMRATDTSMLGTLSNLAMSYRAVGRFDEALRIAREVYSGALKLYGAEHSETLREANNHAMSLMNLERFEEAKSLLRRTLPVARRVLGETHVEGLKLRWTYAETLYKDDGATLDDLREAVTTFEDMERTSRRVLGGAHPITTGIEKDLQIARAALRAREPSPGSASSS